MEKVLTHNTKEKNMEIREIRQKYHNCHHDLLAVREEHQRTLKRLEDKERQLAATEIQLHIKRDKDEQKPHIRLERPQTYSRKGVKTNTHETSTEDASIVNEDVKPTAEDIMSKIRKKKSEFDSSMVKAGSTVEKTKSDDSNLKTEVSVSHEYTKKKAIFKQESKNSVASLEETPVRESTIFKPNLSMSRIKQPTKMVSPVKGNIILN